VVVGLYRYLPSEGDEFLGSCWLSWFVHAGQAGEGMRLRHHEIELSQVLLELYGSRTHTNIILICPSIVNHLIMYSLARYVSNM
jgi:hypothetical protein